MTKKVMRLVDPSICLLECKVCGIQVHGMIRPDSNGRLVRGNWQCPNGCKPEDLKEEIGRRSDTR